MQMCEVDTCAAAEAKIKYFNKMKIISRQGEKLRFWAMEC